MSTTRSNTTTARGCRNIPRSSPAGRAMPRPIAQRMRRDVIRYGAGARNAIDLFAGDGHGRDRRLHPWRLLAGAGRLVFQPSRRRAECPWHRRRDSELRSLPAVSRRRHHRRDAGGRARAGEAGTAARRQRPFRRRPSRRLHAGDRLAGLRCVVAARSRDRGLCHFRPVRSRAAGRDLDQHAPCSSTTLRQGGESVVLESAARGTLDAVVGANESAEYFRQSRTIVDAWGTAGVARGSAIVPDANHFTAIAPLADPQLADGAARLQATRPGASFQKTVAGRR